MKAIIIGPAYPYRGGIADTNESLARSMSEAGIETSIFTFKLQYPSFLFPGKTQFSEDPKPIDLNIKRFVHSLNPFNWVKVARQINNLKPSIVVIRYWIPFLAPCLGTIAKFISKKTTVIGLCDNIIPHEHRIGDKQLTKYFTNNCDAFIAMSHTVKEDIKQFTDKKCLYLAHPINDGLGELLSKIEARKHLGLEANKKYILFFGLIRDYKGLDLLLKSMEFIDEEIKLIIAGEFYSDPKEYFDLIDDLNLKSRVIITNKFIAKEDIKYYFSAVDLVTQTYKTATQSGVTQIAYHFNKPMLVTDVGGLSEIVPHEKVGYVTTKDPSNIASFIGQFYSKNMEKEFVKNILNEKLKYTWGKFVQELLTLQKINR